MGFDTSDNLTLISDHIFHAMETFSYGLVEYLLFVAVWEKGNQLLLAERSESGKSLFFLLKKVVDWLFQILNQLNCVFQRLVDFCLKQLENVRLLFDLVGYILPILFQRLEL